MTNDTPLPTSTPQLTLSEQDIRRISDEERLRTRLRSEFERDKETSHSGWWTFLNSHFGLFLLSSVLLAALTGLYSQAQYYSRQVELRNQDVLKTTTELQYRLAQIRRYTRQMKDAGADRLAPSDFIWYAVAGGPDYYRASLPEFSGISTYGLLGKLRLLGVTEGTDAALQSVIALEDGRTQAHPSGRPVYPQDLLDSQIEALGAYTNGILVPYLDQQRNRSFLRQLLF